MSIIEAAVLGAIQGLTEFIPISSSGHLVIAQYVMNGASDHLFLEWINLGTLLALVIYFRARLLSIARQVINGNDYRLLINILVAALPAALVGYVLAGYIETNSFFGSPWTVVVTLFVVGVLLVLLEQIPKKSPTSDDAMPRSRALTIGLVQVLALIPGVSRSGSTIVAGRVMGLTATRAAEFSFLVSIPIMCGVVTKLLIKSTDRAYFVDNFTTLLVGNAVAFVCGVLAVKFLMKFLEKHPLAIFGWYRMSLAVVLAVVLLVQ